MSSKSSAWRSPWVLSFVAMMVVLVGANGYLIYLANKDNPGLVVDDYYERGQHYEKNMLKKMAQTPDWTSEFHLPVPIVLHEDSRLRFSISAEQGELIVPDQVTLFGYRPSDAKADFSVEMAMLSQGVYEAVVAFPLPGVWDLIVSVNQGEVEHNSSQRVHVAKAQ